TIRRPRAAGRSVCKAHLALACKSCPIWRLRLKCRPRASLARRRSWCAAHPSAPLPASDISGALAYAFSSAEQSITRDAVPVEATFLAAQAVLITVALDADV